MEHLDRVKTNNIFGNYESIFRAVIGSILLALGVFIAAESGIKFQGIGYLLIIGAPFFMLPEEKPMR